MEYQIKSDPQENFCTMHFMFTNKLFYDVTLQTTCGKRIYAHKVVLASCSKYFYELFLTNQNNDRSSPLLVREIDYDTLFCLITWMYTREFRINSNNIQNLLRGAEILQLQRLQYEYIRSQEDKNINEIMTTSQFLNLQIDNLTNLISRTTLEVTREEKIYEGIISWINHDSTARSKYLSDLIKHVRFNYISRHYLLNRIKNDPLIQNDSKCKYLIDCLLNGPLLQMIELKPPRNYTPRILVMGGWNAKNTFEFYDFYKNYWYGYIPPELNLNTKECKLAVINQTVYVICRSGIYHFTSNRDFILVGGMRKKDIGIGVVDNDIYVVGGYGTGNEVEKFNVTHSEWSRMPPMKNSRKRPGVGVLNGVLYAIGGKSDGRILDSVEFYDPNSQSEGWQDGPSLKEARSQAAVGILRNKMYVIGGYVTNQRFNTVECLSPDEEEFQPSAPLNVARLSASVVEYDDKLYVIGGRDEKYNPLKSIEVYCPERNEWELLSTEMNVPRGWVGAAVIENINRF